jgi:hypothetical protein
VRPIILLVTAAIALLTNGQAQAQASTPPDPLADSRIWISGGGGMTSGGAAGVAGVHASVRGWTGAVRYVRAASGNNSYREKFLQDGSVLVGRIFPGDGVLHSIALGAGRAKHWEVEYAACTFDCWYGKRNPGPTTTNGPAPSMTLQIGMQSRSIAGWLAMSGQIHGTYSAAGSHAGVHVALNIGLLR